MMFVLAGAGPGVVRARENYATDFADGAARAWTPAAGTWTVGRGSYEGSGAGLSLCDAEMWSSDFVFCASVQTGGTGKPGFAYNYADGKNFSAVTLDAGGKVELSETIRGARRTLATGFYPGAGENVWVEVEIVRTGTNTTVRVNGARVFARVPEPVLGPGRIGLSVAAGAARFAHVSVTCTPVVIYRQSFDRATAPEWFAADDTWALGGGAFAHGASAGESVARCDYSSEGSDYTYGLSVCLPASQPAARAGAVYDYTDEKNYRAVLLTPEGLVEMRRVVDGVAKVQAKGAFDRGAAGRWIDLTILRTGATTTVNVDGRRVFTQVEQGTAGGGEIGLLAADGAAKFDDVVLADGLDPYRKTFPKIGGIFIGGPRDFDQPSIQAALAKHDFVILGMYPGFEKGGKKPAELLREIRTLNPALVIGNYTNVMETYDKPASGPNPAYTDFIAKLTTEKGPRGAPTSAPNDWWARNSEGLAVGEGAYPRTRMTNITYFVQPDAEGMRYPQWYARNSLTAEHFATAGFDFMFSDNTYADPTMFSTTPRSIDWNRDGRDDSGAASAREFRLGLATYVMKFRQLEPRMFEMGNVGGQRGSHPLATPEFQDLLGAALYEGMMGAGWSDESWSGWNVLMDNYRSLTANVSFPGFILTAAHGTADGRALDKKVRGRFPAAYAFMRYALATCLLGDAYFSYADDGYSIERYKWFDEFDLKLGHAVDPPPASPFENGVYRRRFQNGMVLVNPRTNPDLTARAAQTVTIEPGYRHFRGTQDPVTNNGAPVSVLTLAPGDGVVLVKS